MKDKTPSLVRMILFFLAAACAVAFLFLIPEVVKLVVIAALLSYILDPLANLLESRGMSRTKATVTIFLAFVTLLAVAYIFLLPLFLEEMKSLEKGLSPEQAGVAIARLESTLVENLSFVGVKNLDLAGRLQSMMSHTGEWLLSHVVDAASLLTSMILIPFIVFFLMKDGREFKRSFVSIVPNRYFEVALYLLYKLNVQVGNFLRGQFIDAIIVGLLAMFALWIVGIKYFFLIGLFTGLANLIPYFGPLAGAGLAVVLSILQTGGFEMAVYVMLAFTLIKLFDDAFIQPLVVARSVDMNPLSVLLVILIGGKLFGILGMLLSVPIAGFIKVVIHETLAHYQRYRTV
ncbi:MAG TPA: AI-2E family transporter [Thermodesulfovibrionales bacterium]|nr:AI-2E family transporter [Thermodesulfovibrionales bacterium]